MAWAQLLDVKLKNQVPPGQKPQLVVTPAAPLAGLRLEIARQEDGKSFTVEERALKQGQTVQLAVGDGKGERAHWKGKLIALLPSGNRESFDVSFESATIGELRVTYKREKLDLDARLLEFQLSRPAGRATLTIFGDDGSELGHGEAEFKGEPPGTWLPLRWSASKPGNVMKLELRASSSDGLTTLVKLLPWSVRIPHEEVQFDFGKAEVRPSETPKLDASYQRIIDAVDLARKADPTLPVRLFIAGHTDTVGKPDDNRRLSQARARAIAEWFKQRGLPLPIAFAGFGEEAPKVKTPDNTDEAANRRVDYIVGVEEPLVAKGVKASWAAVK